MNTKMTKLALALGMGATLALAGCGGGGGGGTDVGGGGGGIDPTPVEADPTFSATVALPDAIVGTALSAAVDLNDGFMAVGMNETAATTSLRAAAWSIDAAGTPTTALLPTPVDEYSNAFGTNDAGMVVGEMVPDIGGTTIVAAFWATSATPAVALQPNGASAAYEINEAGMIAGETFDTVAGTSAAVIWENATALPTQLPSTGTSSSAYDINDNAAVTEAVGEMTDAAGTHAVVWRRAGTAPFQAIVLPGSATLTGDAVAMELNDDGHIAGEIVAADGIAHAVRWVKVGNAGTPADYAVEDLGAGNAGGINTANRAVGQDGNGGAAIWRATAPLTPFAVGTTNPANSTAVAINTGGRTVGVNAGKAFIALP